MDEADIEPARDEPRLPRDHAIEQGPIGTRRGGGLRIMPCDRIIGEVAERLAVAARREELERADANMARRDAHEDGARQCGFADDLVTRRHGREPARRRDAERIHGFADQIFAQDRAERGAAVAAAREGRRAGAFELDVAAQAALVHDFAEQDRPPIAQSRDELAELMARIGRGDGIGAIGNALAGQHLDAVLRRERGRIEPKMQGKRVIELDERRRGDGAGQNPCVKNIGQPRIGIVEGDGCWHVEPIFSRRG